MHNYRPKGVREASEILSRAKHFFTYSDPDIDGSISSEVFNKLLRAFGMPFITYVNENRTHGMKLTDEQIVKIAQHNMTMVMVDASMSIDEMKMLLSRGIEVIVIDHHNIDSEELVFLTDPNTGKQGVMINNQYPFEPEEYRFLSGAGVVYYVVQLLAPNLFGLDEKALVGLSLLSDIRPIENPIAQDFLHTTYTHKSPMMDYLLNLTKPEKDYGFGLQTFDRNYIDFTFSPKINALFRLNKGYDAISVFEGTYKTTGELAVYRNIQNAIRDTIIENMEGQEFSNLAFKYVDINLPLPYNFTITNFVGLACSRLKNDGKTYVLMVRENGIIKRGSLRGKCDDVNYLALFRKHGFDAEGHHNAFGVKWVDFDKVDLEALNRDIAELEAGYEERKYAGRIMEVANLAFFNQSKNSQVAEYNNYVRDPSRIFLKYTGNNVERFEKGKAIEFMVDGLKVLSFEPDLKLEDALILPVKERGSYVNFYLKRY